MSRSIVLEFDVRQKGSVNPLEVIEKLIDHEVGWRHTVYEQEGRHFRCFEGELATAEEISQEQYSYVQHLYSVRDYLLKKKG